MTQPAVAWTQFDAGKLLKGFRLTTRTLLGRPSYLGVYCKEGEAAVEVSLWRGGVRAAFHDSAGTFAADAPLRGVRASLPRSVFLAKEVLLPGTDPTELRGMLGFEIAGLFPLSPDEIIWDWYPRRVREDGYTVCRVLAVEKAVAAEHVAAAGLDKAVRLAIEPATVSLANAVLASLGAWPESPAIAVAVTAASAELALVGPRGIECDRGVLWSAGFSPGQLASEISVLLSMQCDEASAPPAKVLVAGDVSDGDLALLSGEMGLAVERLEMPAFMGEGAAHSAERLLAAGAAAGPLLAEAMHIGLVEPARDLAEKSHLRFYQAAVGGALALMIVVLAWGAFAARGRRTAQYVERLEARMAAIAPLAADVDAKRQRLAAIERQVKGQGRVLEVLTTLYKVTPPDIFLTSVEIDSRGVLTIKGHAQQIFQPNEYAVLLEEYPVFGRATQQGPASEMNRQGNKTFIEFTVVRDLAPGGE